MESVGRPFHAPGFFETLLWGSLWACIPFVGGIAVFGYFLEYARYVLGREKADLVPPWRSWEDTRRWLSLGLKPFTLVFLQMIILTLISLLVYVPFIPRIWSSFSLLQAEPDNLEAVRAFAMSILLPLFLGMLAWLVYFHLLPLLYLRYSTDSRPGSLFGLGAALAMSTRDAWTFFLVTSASYMPVTAVVVIVSIVGLIGLVPVIGWAISIYASSLATMLIGYLIFSPFGEFYHRNSPSPPAR
jgi:MFS family permease